MWLREAREILIHSFRNGDVQRPEAEIEPEILEAVRKGVSERFGIPALLSASCLIPPDAFAPQRLQYHSTALLRALGYQGNGYGRVHLGIANVDLFVPELNYVFGEASGAAATAVFSVARLGNFSLNPALVSRRAISEAVHELGHVFGLSHCSRSDCVMFFSNEIAETDRKGSDFCEFHWDQLGRERRIAS